MTRVRALVTASEFCDGGNPCLQIRVLRGRHGGIHEDLDCLLDLHPDVVLSGRNRKLPSGSKVTVLLTLDVNYTCDYWGEHDMEFGEITVGRKTVQVPTRRQQKKDNFFWAQRARAAQAQGGVA